MPSWRSGPRTGTAFPITTKARTARLAALLLKASQRGPQLVPGEDGRIAGGARKAGGIKDHLDSPLPQQADAALKGWMPGQGRVRPGNGDDRQAGAQALVQQTERQRVADTQGQPVDRAERGRGHDERVG